jgi:L-histidine N-alpha-methyltransferase
MPMSQLMRKPVQLTEQDEIADDLAGILEGLRRRQKNLSPKYFYDERGSELFDEICDLPEYYPTNTELSIMQQHVGDMAKRIGPQASLIEFGSGSSLKIRILLQHLEQLAAYVPVDISREHLIKAADAISRDFPDIEVLPVAADFTQPFELPNPQVMPIRNVVYFPGSTIGNFSPDAAHQLLQVMHHEAGENGALLIGIDLQKDIQVIERAYNDSAGVTARFNLNILRRINREFGTNFNLDNFRHRAAYNSEYGRIEMHLISQCKQSVLLAGERVDFVAGEELLTEYSHKYTYEGFANLAECAGFKVDATWTDADQMFAVQYCLRD